LTSAQKFFGFIVSLLLGFALCGGSAQAHLMSAGQGAINLLNDQLVVLIGVDIGVLQGVDDNLDGLLQREEILRHQKEILSQLNKGMTIKVKGLETSVLHEELMVSVHADDNKSTNQLEWGRRISVPGLAANPSPISVRLNWLVGESGASTQRSYWLQVKRIDEIEAAILSPQNPEHTFLVGKWETFMNFVREGMVHFLGGYDHLLFVITLLSAGVNLRRWIGLLSVFTVAHGLTYSLSLYGIFYAPAHIIEPLIAVSIIAISFFRYRGIQWHFALESAIVFAFGLIHGLGFALSMNNLTHGGRFPIINLLGFNLGVELGQVLAALVVFALVRWTRQGRLISEHIPWKKCIAMLGMLLGLIWLWQRVNF
jgi:hypothetical protein